MTRNKLRCAALNLLARRDYSEAELCERLEKAGYPTEEITVVTAGLIQEKLLDDRRFVENYLHYRRRNGFGPLRIQAELVRRGIDAETIHEQLLMQDPCWQADAKAAWEKRFRGILPADFREQAKQMRFLQGRGFTQGQIESVFRSLKGQ